MDKDRAARIAQVYFKSDNTPTPHGWGISGYVFLSSDKGAVVKVYREAEGFATELRVYQSLRKLGLNSLHGLSIPQMRGYRWDLQSIQMDFVIAPFLLDFAGVQFSPPDFSPDVMEDWHHRIEQSYGPNASIAYAVYYSLAKHGIYYMDFRPSNLNLKGLPGVEPFDPASTND